MKDNVIFVGDQRAYDVLTGTGTYKKIKLHPETGAKIYNFVEEKRKREATEETIADKIRKQIATRENPVSIPKNLQKSRGIKLKNASFNDAYLKAKQLRADTVTKEENTSKFVEEPVLDKTNELNTENEEMQRLQDAINSAINEAFKADDLVKDSQKAVSENDAEIVGTPTTKIGPSTRAIREPSIPSSIFEDSVPNYDSNLEKQNEESVINKEPVVVAPPRDDIIPFPKDKVMSENINTINNDVPSDIFKIENYNGISNEDKFEQENNKEEVYDNETVKPSFERKGTDTVIMGSKSFGQVIKKVGEFDPLAAEQLQMAEEKRKDAQAKAEAEANEAARTLDELKTLKESLTQIVKETSQQIIEEAQTYETKAEEEKRRKENITRDLDEAREIYNMLLVSTDNTSKKDSSNSNINNMPKSKEANSIFDGSNNSQIKESAGKSRAA